jgi:hypothetical protein
MSETIQKSNPIPENEPVYVPRVDVRENAEGFVVVADCRAPTKNPSRPRCRKTC